MSVKKEIRKFYNKLSVKVNLFVEFHEQNVALPKNLRFTKLKKL